MNLKYSKYHKFKYSAGNRLEMYKFRPSFHCTIALQASQYGRVTVQQIEACRMAIRRKLKACGKRKRRSSGDFDLGLQSRLFPYCGITRKPISIPMGKGKGKVHRWVNPVRKGQILYESRSRLSDFWILSAFGRGCSKLSVKSRVVNLVY